MRLTDGGLETSLIFRHGVDLPMFAAFPLLESEQGRATLRAYWEPYLQLARETGLAFVVDTPTWRANPDWASKLGCDGPALTAANAAAARFARDLAEEVPDAVVNGVVGPRGDGYVVGETMMPDQAAAYHSVQLRALVDAGVDQVTAVTLTYRQEAVGFLRAAAGLGVPAYASFTVEVDGRLPEGVSLRDAVELTDRDTDGLAAGFWINCAHPTHIAPALETGAWLDRITGLRANASSLSHAELDAAEELDAGDPDALAEGCRDLLAVLTKVDVVGGCCGTDDRHVRALSDLLGRP